MNKFNKIIEYGLYLLVFLLPLQTRWIIKAGELNGGYWEYGTISLYATDILILILLMLFFISIIKKFRVTRYALHVTRFWWFIALIELAIFISIFFAPDKLLAIFSYARFLLGVGLFWLIISAEYNKIKLLWSLIAGAFFQALLGIWQFSSQSSFASKWLGMAAHNPAELGTSVVETTGFDGVAERWLRAYGGLDHPNILGGLLTIGILLLISRYLENSKSETLNYKQILNSNLPTDKKIQKNSLRVTRYALHVICYALSVTALFFTFSRGAWAGFLAGLIAMLIILFWQKNIQATKKALALIFTGAIIIIFLFNLYSNMVLTRLSKDTRLEIKSNTERLESCKYAKEIIKKHWLFGVGIGNYTLALKNEIDNKQESYFYQPVHNVFLLIWAEAGILGLAGFLGLMLCVMCYVLREKRNGEKALNIVLGFSIIFALTAMMLVDHWYWSLHFGILFLWVVLGLIALDFSNKECYNNEVIINKK